MLHDIFPLSQNFIKINNRHYRRYFLKEDHFKSRFSILIGQRGVGKTTTIIQYLMLAYNDVYNKKMLYIPSDHILIGKNSLYEIAEEFYNLGGEIICFDEIHKYPNWSGELKSIYDSFPNLKIIASGSSALKISKGSHDLSRRAIIYKLNGLSFREYLELKFNIFLDKFSLTKLMSQPEYCASNVLAELEKKTKSKILVLFKEYLEVGYYPYFLELNDTENLYITIEQNIQTTLESDLISIYPQITGISINKIKKLLSIIADSVPFKPDLRKLKELLDIGDERTLKTYINYLEEAGLIKTLSSSSSGLKKLEKPDKIYLNNTNQIVALQNENTNNIGNIRETFFINSVSEVHHVTSPLFGDFLVDHKFTFEVGGKNKNFSQIKNVPNSYLAIDGIETGSQNTIPLWLFGFLY